MLKIADSPARIARVIAFALVSLLIPSLNAARKPKSSPPKAVVESPFDRQIRNAQYAGDGDITLRDLRQKLAADPASIDTRLALAAAYEQQGAIELALDHYRIAVGQYHSELAASRLSSALDRLGDSEQASQVLVQFCDSHPAASSSILSELGILFDEMNQFQQGERYHLRALTAALAENAPAQDALHSNLGYNWIQQKHYLDAQAQLRTALELNPHSQVAHNNLALALAAGPSAGPVEIQEALLHWQSTSGPAAAHNNLAAVYMEQNRIPDARRELLSALEFDRTNSTVLRNLDSLGVNAQAAAATAEVAASTAHISFWKRVFQNHSRHRSGPGVETAQASQHSQSKSAIIK